MKAHVVLPAAIIALAGAYLGGSAAFWRWGQAHMECAVLHGGHASRRVRALGFMDGWRLSVAQLLGPGVSLLSLERERSCSPETIAELEAATAAVRADAGVGPMEMGRCEYDGESPPSVFFSCTTPDGRSWLGRRAPDGRWVFQTEGNGTTR